jgi:hypothetical protein
VVVAADVQGEINIQDKLEVTEVKAFSPDNLPKAKELSYDNGEQLKDYLEQAIALH